MDKIMKYLKLYEAFNSDYDYDVVIIGGGIAGLYTAYQLSKTNKSFILIERDFQLGGRIKMDKIDGVDIPTGAAYLRWDKDKSLRKLITNLDIKVTPYELTMDKTFPESDFDEMLKKLKSSLKDYSRDKIDFKEYAIKVLGKEDYRNLINMMGYSDFEKADFEDTVINYGLDDNISGNEMVNVDWNKLISKLVKSIGNKRILLNKEVKEIKSDKNSFTIDCGEKITCKKVVVATQISSVKKLIKEDIYKGIESQEFIKIFAKVEGLESVKNYTVVDSPLRKVIPIKNDVYCIAFSDNKDAIYLNSQNKSQIEKLLKEDFDIKGISSIKKFFWKEGTHYYKPLSSDFKSRPEFIKNAQRPDKNIFVVGECVARKQGWVNGALETVDNVINEITTGI